MSFLFDRRIPQPQFLKVARLDRATIENWTRSGALAPETSGRSPLFAAGDFLKVRMMLAFKEQFAIPPSRSAAFADGLLERFGEQLARAIAGVAAPIIMAMRGQSVPAEDGGLSPFCEPVFSATFALHPSGDNGMLLTVDNHMPGSIVLLLPLQLWTRHVAFDFAAAVFAHEGAASPVFDQLLADQDCAR